MRKDVQQQQYAKQTHGWGPIRGRVINMSARKGPAGSKGKEMVFDFEFGGLEFGVGSIQLDYQLKGIIWMQNCNADDLFYILFEFDDGLLSVDAFARCIW